MFAFVLISACLVSFAIGQCTDDDNYRIRPYSGAPLLTCSEVAAQYPYHCTEASTSDIGLNPGGKCCASCNALSNSVKKCTDLPGPGLSITGTSITGKTCQEMATDWPSICAPSFWGGNWNTCCRYCKDNNVDWKTCTDIIGTITLGHSDGTTSSGMCPDMAAGGYCDSYSLGGIQNHCCASCPCTDNSNASVSVRANGVWCTNCSCAALLAQSSAHLEKACCKNKDNAMNDCCATCRNNISC